jgi:hypothetical protein
MCLQDPSLGRPPTADFTNQPVHPHSEGLRSSPSQRAQRRLAAQFSRHNILLDQSMCRRVNHASQTVSQCNSLLWPNIRSGLGRCAYAKSGLVQEGGMRSPSYGLGIQWAGALVNVVDMPYMQRVPNVPTTAVELARPDLDQTKATMVVESYPYWVRIRSG